MAKALLQTGKAAADEIEAEERAFDVRLITSVIAVVNAVDFEQLEALPRKEWQARCDPAHEAFSWLGPTMAERAKKARLIDDPRGWLWNTKGSTWQQCRQSAHQLRWIVRYFSGDDRIAGKRAFDQVIDSTLRFLPIYTRYRFMDGRAVRVTIPVLRDIVQCTAYAVAIMAEDRCGLRGRVRECPFIPRGKTQTHLFLDDSRLEPGASQQGKPRIYCSTQHGGADRKRKFDARKSQ